MYVKTLSAIVPYVSLGLIVVAFLMVVFAVDSGKIEDMGIKVQLGFASLFLLLSALMTVGDASIRKFMPELLDYNTKDYKKVE